MPFSSIGSSANTFTPSSSVSGPEPLRPFVAAFDGALGTSSCENRLHGQSDVVKFHVFAPASAWPSSPLIVAASCAVYAVARASAADGVSVAVRVAGSYATPAGTSAPDEVRSENDVVVIVAGSMARENVAVTVDASATTP